MWVLCVSSFVAFFLKLKCGRREFCVFLCLRVRCSSVVARGLS